MNINGKLQKNGGNVMSYFCTPKGQVVHAVGGPVSPNRLLKEAKWAVQIYDEAIRTSGSSQTGQAKMIEGAHLAALGTNPENFYNAIRSQYPASQNHAQNQMAKPTRNAQWSAKYRSPKKQVQSPVLEARRSAAQSFGSDRVHQILAAQPLAHINQVYREMFEDVVNEEVAETRDHIFAAARGMKLAREKGKPILLTLYDEVDDYGKYDEETKQLYRRLLSTKRVATLLNKFVVVAVPLDELAALSNLADVPVYRVRSKSTPLVILARSSGEQFAALQGGLNSAQLCVQMEAVYAQAQFDRADSLLAQGKFSTAESLLRRLISSTKYEHLRTQARSKIASLNIDWAKSLASTEAGREQAIRKLKRVQLMSKDSHQRDLASRQITQLASLR